MWSKADSFNLKRIADALEVLANKKTFVPSDAKVEISVADGAEDEEQIKKANEARDLEIKEVMQENAGKFVWEEDNVHAEAIEDYEYER